MKKLIYVLMAFSLISIAPAHAITKTPAKDISTTTTAFTECLSSSNTDVQSSLNKLDSCMGGVQATNWIASGDNIYNGNSGNVGIGSSSPSQKLDVVGTIKASTDILIGNQSVCQEDGTNCPADPVGANPTASVGLSAVNGVATTFMRSDAAPALSQAIAPTWTGNHIFAPASGNTVFTAGNVGINTTTPASKLAVGGGSAIGAGYTNTSAPTNGLIVQGNVGIGSTAPGAALDVAGKTRTTTFQLTTSPTNAYVLTSDASGNGTWQPASGGGGATWVTKTSNYTASAGDNILCDSSGGAITITLPASPSANATVTIKTGGSAATNAITMGRNGSTIFGLSEDQVSNTPNMQLTYIYDGTTWRF